MGAAFAGNRRGLEVDRGLGLKLHVSVAHVPILAAALLITSCAARRAALFRVVPANPYYFLRSPEAEQTPFPDVLARYAGVGDGWVDLRPGIELRIENAYYREGTTQRDVANYLGTATVRYRVVADGSLQSERVEANLKYQPTDQPAIDQLLSLASRNRAFHRFFYQVLINQRDEHRRAVLLSAAGKDELDQLSEQLAADPGVVCGGESADCTVFPSTSTAALEIQIVVNGDRRAVTWRSEVRNVAVRPKHLKLLRLHDGRKTPVRIDPKDPEALRLPLLPGDRIDWR